MRSFYRKRKIIFVLLIVVGVLSLSSITYAIFTVTTTQSGTNEINTMECLELTFSNQENNINLVNTYPMTDERGAKNTPYTFTITNNCGAYIEYSVGLVIDNSNTLEDKYVKTMFSLKDDVGEAILLTDREEGKIYNDNKTYFFRRDGLANGDSYTYKLRLWVDGSGTTETVSNKSFNGQIIINAYPQQEKTKSTITLDLDGGYSSQTFNVLYYENDDVVLNEPTKEGNIFVGWEIVSGDGVLNDNTLKVGKISTVLKAIWKSDYYFDFTNDEQTFTAPVSGYYMLELWGAQGGTYNETFAGGYGGYSKGQVFLSKNETIYINVGGTTATTTGGYNGGGTGGNVGYGGGGATHIAKVSGLLSTLSANEDAILIVAGGGGGAFYESGSGGVGGSGGGYIGNAGVYKSRGVPYGGTQSAGGTCADATTIGGSFGLGGSRTSYSAGGGGGYYGGAAGGVDVAYSGDYGTGGGGSGYIGNSLLTNKVMYCYNCGTSNGTDVKTVTTTCTNSNATENCSKQGNGYVKITFIKTAVTDNDLETSKEFDFVNKEQQFTIPQSGTYKIEIWGAQGGTYNETYAGGYGGYSVGLVTLNSNDVIYINIGGTASGTSGGYNGGGNGGTYGLAGGGATHVATLSGVLSSLQSNANSIIMVAGGGGGAFYESGNGGSGGSGGGYIGNAGVYKSRNVAYGGTQSSGGTCADATSISGSFGLGGSKSSTNYTSGGGGGYYGGAAGGVDKSDVGDYGTGGGGSGYISNTLLTSKSMYCFNCETSDDETIKTVSTTCAEETPTENCAKKGSGYAKITLVS